MLCQLSYSHRNSTIIATAAGLGRRLARTQIPRYARDDSLIWVYGWLATGHCSLTTAPLHPPDTNVFKSQRAQTRRIEQVFRVHDDRRLEQVTDAVEIERAELRPARAHDERV